MLKKFLKNNVSKLNKKKIKQNFLNILLVKNTNSCKSTHKYAYWVKNQNISKNTFNLKLIYNNGSKCLRPNSLEFNYLKL